MGDLGRFSIGMSESVSKTIAEQDIALFGQATGDMNPVHFDEAFARTTIFKTRIAHGMLTASLFSALLGTRLPGPGTIYLGQTLRFKAPVKIGDHVTATVAVKELHPEKSRITLDCVAKVGDVVVLEGEALVMV